MTAVILTGELPRYRSRRPVLCPNAGLHDRLKRRSYIYKKMDFGPPIVQKICKNPDFLILAKSTYQHQNTDKPAYSKTLLRCSRLARGFAPSIPIQQFAGSQLNARAKSKSLWAVGKRKW